LRLISKNALGIVSPSLYLKDLIRETISECPIEHIPNGIDISRFTVGTKQKRILMTGRLLPRKGFQHILTALRGIDTDFEVHIAGDGPMLSRLRQIADTLDVNVTFHGWIANDSTLLKELYETSSIFCLPSERENGSISLLEAMLSGMAVITSNVSGCPETVGDTGLVVSPNDPGQLQQALVQLISSESLCRKLGSKARQRVEDLYNWEIIGTRYLDLFERINT
jgi:glycosyltransferase involved in cell wall biosynthesis